MLLGMGWTPGTPAPSSGRMCIYHAASSSSFMRIRHRLVAPTDWNNIDLSHGYHILHAMSARVEFQRGQRRQVSDLEIVTPVMKKSPLSTVFSK